MADSWTFSNLEANEKGLKPMPIFGKPVNNAVVVARWGSPSTAMKAALAAVVVLLVTGVGIGVAAAAGAFNPSEKASKITDTETPPPTPPPPTPPPLKTFTEPDPGLYNSMKASMLVNGEGSQAAKLTANDALMQKLSKSVMIDLKDHLPTDALEEIDEITVAVHTKKDHKNGINNWSTLRPVTPAQVGTHTYVDILPSTYDPSGTSLGRCRYFHPVTSYDDSTGAEMGVYLGPTRAYDGAGFIAMNSRVMDFGLLPVRNKEVWTKNKLFPCVVVFSTGGGQHQDALPQSAFGPSARLAQRVALSGDFIVLDMYFNQATSDDFGWAKECHKMLTWAKANLPIDPTKIMSVGTSGGGGMQWGYLARYGADAHITHANPGDTGIGFMMDFLVNGYKENGVVIHQPFTAKLYAINQIGFDNTGSNTDRFELPYLKMMALQAGRTNVRFSLVKPIGRTAGDETADFVYKTMRANMPKAVAEVNIGVSSIMAGGFPSPGWVEHWMIAWLCEFYPELSPFYELMDEEFDAGLDIADQTTWDAYGGRAQTLAIDPLSPNSGYAVGDRIKMPHPAPQVGGQAIVFTITADMLTGDTVTGPPTTLDYPGLFLSAFPFSFPTTNETGSGSGLKVFVTEASALRMPSLFGPHRAFDPTKPENALSNDELIDPYEWFLSDDPDYGHTAQKYAKASIAVTMATAALVTAQSSNADATTIAGLQTALQFATIAMDAARAKAQATV